MAEKTKGVMVLPMRKLEDLKKIFSPGNHPTEREAREKFWSLCYLCQDEDEFLRQGLEIIRRKFPEVAENLGRIVSLNQA